MLIGCNVWIEENMMVQCQVDDEGCYDLVLFCEFEEQVDGFIVYWKEIDNVIVNNMIWMLMWIVNGFWGIIGYIWCDGVVCENFVGNEICGNIFYGCGIYVVYNMCYVFADNVIYDGLIFGFNFSCMCLNDNCIEWIVGENYKLWNVVGVVEGNVFN